MASQRQRVEVTRRERCRWPRGARVRSRVEVRRRGGRLAARRRRPRGERARVRVAPPRAACGVRTRGAARAAGLPRVSGLYKRRKSTREGIES